MLEEPAGGLFLGDDREDFDGFSRDVMEDSHLPHPEPILWLTQATQALDPALTHASRFMAQMTFERVPGVAGAAGSSSADHPGFRASAATCTKAQMASGWRAHARKAAAIASTSARVAKPYSTARLPIGDVSKRSA